MDRTPFELDGRFAIGVVRTDGVTEVVDFGGYDLLIGGDGEYRKKCFGRKSRK